MKRILNPMIIENPEKLKKRLTEFNKMNEVWNESDDVIKAYLKGCINTVELFVFKERVN